MPLTKIISGHQTGADIAAIDACLNRGFPCGGWVPRGRKTEAGPLPSRYVVEEMAAAEYLARTRQNVLDSDGTVIFSHGVLTGGSDQTRKLALAHAKPWLHVDFAAGTGASPLAELRRFIAENHLEVLNVAGPRASGDPAIYQAVYRVIDDLLAGR